MIHTYMFICNIHTRSYATYTHTRLKKSFQTHNYILACTLIIYLHVRARALARTNTHKQTHTTMNAHIIHTCHMRPRISYVRVRVQAHACSDACTYTHTRACARHTYQRTQTCCTLASASALIRASSAAFCRASSSALGVCVCVCVSNCMYASRVPPGIRL